ncbi:CPBP family intramembrane glutamic endopeptidase [Streptococcus himalayensis]|uniref:CAAX amino protease n=1 Tax=Streptococcus himalayensis TaxID=1888195 RepID=A0A917EDP4_9STRE|nr:type II CAAX endopeptidase family protein [Streptococcus himalayensis]GGE25653.1 CAAX amino protease [Streptococcus himalayensis]
MKQKIVNGLKFLGLFLLIPEINGLPALLMAKSQQLPLYAESVLAVLLLIGMIWIIRAMWKRYEKYLPEEQKQQTFSWKHLLPLLGYTVLVYVATAFGGIITALLSHQETTNNQAMIDKIGELVTLQHLPSSLLFIVGISILTPMLEELLFRGFGVVYFFKESQNLLAGIVTSTIFAFAHLIGVNGIDWPSFPLYFFMGVAIYLSYAYRKNIKDSMIIHIMKNILLGILLLVSMFS